MMWGNNWMMSNGMWGDHRFLWFLGPLAVIDLALRGLALWRSAKAGQQWWFVALLLVNSLGILPAIYLYLNRDSAPNKTIKKSSKKR